MNPLSSKASNYMISSLNISDGMQLFITAGYDGAINIYELEFKPKLLRSIRHNSPITNALLTQNPLPGLVVFGRKISVYGINGKILTEVAEESVISPIIVEDSKFMEHLVYAKEENLIIRKLPFLEHKVIKLEKKDKIIKICGNGKYLLVLYEDNTILLIR